MKYNDNPILPDAVYKTLNSEYQKNAKVFVISNEEIVKYSIEINELLLTINNNLPKLKRNKSVLFNKFDSIEKLTNTQIKKINIENCYPKSYSYFTFRNYVECELDLIQKILFLITLNNCPPYYFNYRNILDERLILLKSLI